MTVKIKWLMPFVLLTTAVLFLGCGNGGLGGLVSGGGGNGTLKPLEVPDITIMWAGGNDVTKAKATDFFNTIPVKNLGILLKDADEKAYNKAFKVTYDKSDHDEWLDEDNASASVSIDDTIDGIKIEGDTSWSVWTSRESLSAYWTGDHVQDEEYSTSTESSRTYTITNPIIISNNNTKVSGVIVTEYESSLDSTLVDKTNDTKNYGSYHIPKISVTISYFDGNNTGAILQFSIALDRDSESQTRHSTMTNDISDIKIYGIAKNLICTIDSEDISIAAWYTLYSHHLVSDILNYSFSPLY
jgi:hypothetical protein